MKKKGLVCVCVYSLSPAGDITQDSVIKQDVLLSTALHLQTWDAGGIVVHHHDTRTVQPLSLVHQQVTALIIHIVSDYKALFEEGRKRKRDRI